jgi:hypothetical protein
MRRVLAIRAHASSSPFILILLKLFFRYFFVSCLRLTWLCTFFNFSLWLHLFIWLIRWSLGFCWNLIRLWSSSRFCQSIISFFLFNLLSFYIRLRCFHFLFLLSSIVFFAILVAVHLVDFCSYSFSGFSSGRVQRLI